MDNFEPLSNSRHQYSLIFWQKALFLLLAILLLCVGFWTSCGLPGAGGVASLPGLFLVVLAFYLAAHALRSRITIEGAKITVRSVFSERAATLDQIEGFRIIQTRNGSYTRLCLKDGGGIRLSSSFDTDDDYRAWFQQVIDLDLRDREAMLRQIEQSAELGSTPEERLQALSRARLWNYGLIALAVLAAVGLFFAPERYHMYGALVLACVPVAVYWLLSSSPLTFALLKSKADPRADLLFAVLIASFGLYAAATQYHFVAFKPLLTTILPVGVIFFLAYASTARQNPSRLRALLVLLVFSGFYSYGLAASLDVLADGSPATSFAVPVLAKHVTHGKSDTYSLDLPPWGPFAEPNSLTVPEEVFQSAGPGTQVCFELFPGRLGAPWLRLGACPQPEGVGVEQ